MKKYENLLKEMKKIIVDFFLLGTGSFLVYKIISIVFFYTGVKANYLIAGFCLTIFFIAITYNRLWSKKNFPKPKNEIYFGVILVIIFLIFSYCYRIGQKTNDLLTYLELEHKRGWKGSAHTSDSLLGFIPLKNARAFHTFYVGEDIPMAFNEYGFRIPLKDTLLSVNYDSLGILFLGCSFTYGDATLAEQTFAYLTAQKTGLTYINAGVCAYGLSQMVILADRLIPKYKPKYLVVQYSPWLIERAVKGYAPVFFGSIPTPYFTIINDSLSIEKPFYKTQMYDDFFEKIVNRKTVQWKYLNLIRFFLKEDFFKIKTQIFLLENKIKKPTNNNLRAQLLAYHRVIQNAKKNGTKVIILGLYKYRSDDKNLSQLIDNDDVTYVDADPELLEYMESRNLNDFVRTFHQWRLVGKKFVWVDEHPNPLAHQLISKVIVNKILDEEHRK